MPESDHDLLVKLHENVKLNFEQVKADIKDIKDNTANKIKQLEDDFSVMTARIERVEKKQSNQSVAIGIYIAIGVFVVSLMIYHILGK